MALDGKPLGMWVVIQSNGFTVRSGFTPLTFVGTAGVSYSIVAHDYLAGSIFFDHWENGSTSKTRALTLNADTAITANYRTATTHNLVVNSVDMSGNAITGYYTTIRSGSTTVKTGFTSMTYAGDHGASYTVSVSDYGDMIFDHWENGSTAMTRTVTLDADTTVTAYYKNNSLPPARYNLTVNAANISGGAIDSDYFESADLDRHSIQFDGIAQYAQADSNAVFDIDANDFSFYGLIYPSSTADSVIIAKRNGPDSEPGYYIGIDNGQLYSEFGDGSNNRVMLHLATTTLLNSTWYAFAVSFDRDTDMTIHLYKFDTDAYDNASVPISSHSAAVINSQTFTVGKRSDTDSTFFPGYIDNLRVLLDVAVSQEQFLEFATTEIISGVTPTSSYDFDEGTGTTAMDPAGSNDLALFNDPIWSSNIPSESQSAATKIANNYITIQLGSTTIETGNSPLTHTGDAGASYTILVEDFENYTFDHWEDGSVTRSRTVALNADTAVTAYYKDSSLPPNTDPSAVGDSAETNEDTPVIISILDNDSDPDGDSLTIASVTDPANGTAIINGSSITYTPDAGLHGTDAFDYTVSDGNGGTDTATVTVTVNQVSPMYSLTVRSVDLSGNAITGYQTTIQTGGTTVKTGPTPQTYTGNAGTYTVSVQDSASMIFDHWENGSTTRSRTVILSADTTVTAYFKSNAPTTHVLTVKSSDMQNNPITGLYTTVRAGSTTVKTGFTALTYTGNSGTSYTVTVSDYGSNIFDHWDNGSTIRSRTLSMSSDTTVTAYFRKPFIAISPTSGTPGTQLTVTGSYFSPSSSITITYDGTTVSTTPSSIVTSSAGAFTASFTVPSFSDTGPQSVRAVDGRGWNSQATFLDTSVPEENSLQSMIPKTGVFVALYMYPGTTGSVHWQKVIDEKNAHPSVPIVAAFNPSSGPGSSKNSVIATWVDKLQDAGIIAIGYTYDDYGTRSLSALKADADKYKNWYNADGLFIDEFTNKVGYENHYRDLTTYAKSIGMKLTMGNPGTDVPPSYIGTVTVMNTSEGRGYISMTDPNLIGAGWVSGGYLGWHSEHDKRNFIVIRYDIDSLDTSFVTGASDKVGLIYVTNGDDSNGRWFHVPPYFSTLVATLDR